VLRVEGSGINTLSLSPDFETGDNGVAFIGVNPAAPAGILPPGAEGRITIYAHAEEAGSDTLELTIDEYLHELIDWTAAELDMRPDEMPDEEWNELFAQLQTQIGDTWDEYHQALAADATLIPPLLGPNHWLDRVFQLEVDKARAALTTSVSGHVYLNDTDNPLSDLEIDLFDHEAGEYAGTVSLMDGSFLIPAVVSGTYEVTFVGAVLTDTAPLTVTGQDVEGLAWTLAPGASIEGCVLLGTGVPLAEVPVSALGGDSGAFSTESDDAGCYAIDSLPAGTYELVGGGGAYTEVSVEDVQLAQGKVRTNVNLVLEPAGFITGTVTGPGGPVEDAIVSALAGDGTGSGADTDATGAYTVTGLSTGMYTVSAAAPDLWGDAATGIAVTADDTVGPVNLVLAEAGAVSGTVTSECDGSPAPYVAVLLSGGARSFGGASDKDGNLFLTEIPAGAYDLTAGGGLYMTVTQSVSVAPGVTTPVSLAVAPLGTVTATVVDSQTGHPVPNILVYALRAGEIVGSSITDLTGRHIFDALGPGAYRILLGEDFGPGMDHTDVTIDSGNTSANAELSIAVAGIVSGTVFEADGVTPVGNAAVGLVADGDAILGTATEDDGRYCFVMLSDGAYGLQAVARGRAFAPIEGVAVSGGASITAQDFIAGSDTVTVLVKDGATGAPLEDALVHVSRADTGLLLDDMGTFLTDADGTTAITGTLPGSYRLMARAEDRAFATVTVTVPGGEDPVTMLLRSPVSVSGRVLDQQSDPVGEAAVTLVGGGQSFLTSTDRSGAFELVELASGTYDLSIIAPGFESYVEAGLEPPDGDVVVTATLEPATILVSGTVSGPVGPLGRVLVVARDGSGRYTGHAITDEHGKYAIDSFLPGGASVLALAPGYLPSAAATLSLSSGQLVSQTDLLVEPVALSDPRGLPPLEALDYNNRYWRLPPDRALAWLQEQADLYDELKSSAHVYPSECQTEYDYALRKLRSFGEACGDFVTFQGVRWKDEGYPIEVFAGEVFPKLIRELKQLELPHSQVIKLWMLQGGSEYDFWACVRDIIGGYDPDQKRSLPSIAGSIAHELQKIRFDDRMSASDVRRISGTARDVLTEIESLRERACDPDVIPRVNVDENGRVTGPSAMCLYVEANRRYEAIERKVEEIRRAAGLLSSWDRSYEPCEFAHYEQQEAVDELLECAERHAPKPPESSARARGGQTDVDDEESGDPNDKVGPAAYGTGGYVQPATMSFEVQFENDPDVGATIPAQEVFVTDTLDADLDLSTFEFTGFGFNNREFSVPAGLSHYETTIDLRPEGIDLLVPVVLDLDTRTRTLAATFRSLDPLTGQLPDDIDAGLLPVNDKELHNGEGFFSYLVRPTDGLTSGTVITNQASIVFDVNPPILTPITLHTLDTQGPTSSVQPLPEESPSGFTVTWSGEDDPNGSGIALYEIYVSEDGGSFTRWITATPATSASFPGAGGWTYHFYSIAVDGVGHREAAPANADATTTVVNAVYLPLVLRN
jgi:protocatechuate 3,4-dioxygenase beta subunit